MQSICCGGVHSAAILVREEEVAPGHERHDEVPDGDGLEEEFTIEGTDIQGEERDSETGSGAAAALESN